MAFTKRTGWVRARCGRIPYPLRKSSANTMFSFLLNASKTVRSGQHSGNLRTDSSSPRLPFFTSSSSSSPSLMISRPSDVTLKPCSSLALLFFFGLVAVEHRQTRGVSRTDSLEIHSRSLLWRLWVLYPGPSGTRWGPGSWAARPPLPPSATPGPSAAAAAACPPSSDPWSPCRLRRPTCRCQSPPGCPRYWDTHRVGGNGHKVRRDINTHLRTLKYTTK